MIGFMIFIFIIINNADIIIVIVIISNITFPASGCNNIIFAIFN